MMAISKEKSPLKSHLLEMPNRLAKLKLRKYYAITYASLGYSFIDKIKLALVGWKRCDVNSNSDNDQRSATIRINSLQGKKITFKPKDICHLAIFEELLVHGAYNLKRVMFDPDLIIDVGAHIGLFSTMAQVQWPNALVLAFEPHPNNALYCRRNFMSNNINGVVMQSAASSQAGFVSFDLGGGMGSIHSGGSHIVATTSIRDMIRVFPLSKILLKIDIEGGEFDILPSILPSLPSQCSVFLELHGTLLENESMIQTIRDNNLKAEVISHRISETNQCHYMDLFLERPRS